ncbi:RE1-silencing transcription factor [Varanus komodoensis]|uniref:RE1 silencing transcription factor n=1 Tax=Varanus komodoensis TaxID=61221 RepID=A0A8D2J7F6_VARKO|nr:RE1-silencing transcription factor [Varanus komodoensis]XP_044274802.1 RE1-silencing transcription factor [Varanus komodoensis]XP_044274803.1 RE1-silencing transcription factor [Varanus komodoensis]
MAMQVLGQSGGSSLFSGSNNLGMSLSNDMYDFPELSKAELAAPQLIMLANVALTGEVNGSCCDYMVGEERQMAELTTVGNTNFSDSDGEGIDDAQGVEPACEGLEDMDIGALRAPEVRNVETEGLTESSVPHTCSPDKGFPLEMAVVPENVGDKCKSLKSKPFHCKPCQYEAESEKEFVHHIRVHSAKRFIVEEKAEKHGQAKETDSSTTDEVDFSKGPIRCDRCGYNTNRYDHYLAHLKHHNKAGENERVYKCTICTYTTVSEYHWKKHLRNHFPRKVYTCSQCSYFSDRKNNYVQHIRTHTGERPYCCSMCPYSSSQKTHLTRHMRTHSGEKPFKCEQCSYVASNQHEVTRHARQVHDGPKPLACPHCDYKTADRSNFKKHVELHVSPRQFLCPVCEYAASKKCNLQYHIKSRHPDCCDITMDVSKVRLRTKKSEVNTSDSINGDNNKVEQEQTKKELTEKKSERAVKEEKKENLSKEKKLTGNVGVGQVTTRSRKTVAENKEAYVKTEKTTEKNVKTKKTKRKAETNSVPFMQDFATDTDPVVKKKKKTEKKSPKCQNSQKGESKLEVTKKQNSCLKKNKKKKHLKTKSSGNNKKPDCEKITDEELVHKECPTMQGGESKPSGSCNVQQPVVAPDDGGSQFDPGENRQDQEPPPAQHVAQNMEPEVRDQEMPIAEETTKAVSQNEVEMQLEIVPGTSSKDSDVILEKETEVLKNSLPDLAQDIQTSQTCEMEVVKANIVQEVQPVPACEIVTHSANPEDDNCKNQLQAEDPVGTPPSQLPGKLEQSTKADLVSVSPSRTVASENQEMEEDEGIHSHDGSDISDNISEGSDDSGLNGARTAQEKTSQKPSQEVAEAKAAKENYVCIFCDRSFKKEGEYSKHLNRHLVNVYYLEKATKEQD